MGELGKNIAGKAATEYVAMSNFTVTAEATANGAVGDLCSIHWTADADI